MVVRHVAERVEALHVAAAHREVGVVRLDRLLVGDDRVVPAADARVDVRGHVHEMPRARDQLAQSVGSRDTALRVLGRLDRVHVQVQRAGVIRVPCHDRFQDRDDLRRVSLGLQLRVVVIPRLQVHQCLGVKSRGVEVVRSSGDELRGRLRVGLVERAPIVRRILRVARRKRADEGLLALAGARCQFDRALQSLPGLRVVRRVHAAVDVRTEHQGRAPPAHRALGVEFRGLEEGAFRSVVVEPVGEHQSLVEPALHFRLRTRDGKRVVAEPFEQGRADRSRDDGAGRGRRLVGAASSVEEAGGDGDGDQRNDKCAAHRTPP